jgi:4,5:9,10-diseco-3-hydroxy-5,9,17-trioxoandrosta-1(10),2-diene-4-oate hydrolase
MLAVKRWGKGDPVVCLHAIGHGAADFEAFAKRVGDGFEVIAIDWPGQGDSPADGGPVTPEHYADLLEAELPKLCKSAPIVIGNSLGGATAILLASRRPEAVRALVLCNSGGLAPVGPFEQRAIGAIAAFFRAGARRAWWFKTAFAAYYAMVLPRAPKRRREIVADAYRIAPILAEAWEGFRRPEADLRAFAPTIQTPALFAWAKSDRLIPWAKSRAAAEQFPRHAVRLFRGGHAAFLEDADAFAAAFREGVQKLDHTMADKAA